MMFVLRGNTKFYMRQAVVEGGSLLFAQFVGSLNEMKRCMSFVRGLEGYQNFGIYSREPGSSEQRYESTIYPNSCGYKSIFKRIEGTEYYELTVISKNLYDHLQNVRYGVTGSDSYYYFMFKASDIARYIPNFPGPSQNNITTSFSFDPRLLFNCPVFVDEVFKRISLSSSVPLLREWLPTLLNMEANHQADSNFIRLSHGDPWHYWDVAEEDRIVAYHVYFNEYTLTRNIHEAFSHGLLQLGDANHQTGHVNSVHTLTEYLNVFGDTLVQRAHDRFNPLYTPGVSKPNERAETFFTNSQYYGNLNFFNSQKDVISSIALSFDRNKRTIVVGECGVGKTAIALGAIYTHSKKKNPATLVMAPGHMVEKWATEIKRLYPFAQTCIVSDMSDVIHWEERIRQNKLTAPLFLIMGKDVCKTEHECHPYLCWDSERRTYVDPTAPDHKSRKVNKSHPGQSHNYQWYGKEKNSIDYEVVTYFLKPNSKNQYVSQNVDSSRDIVDRGSINAVSCWTAANPSNQTEWVKAPGYGWVNTKAAKQYIDQCDAKTREGDKLEKEELKAYAIAKAAFEDNVTRGVRRYNISKYIRRRIPFDYFIADEVHLYSSKDTAQGQAFGNFLCAAKYTIALTGTLLNGYAQNIFSMLFRMYPHTFIQNGFKYNSVTEFAKRYGVIETTEEFSNTYYHGNTPVKRTEKYKPGVSPLLFSKFLLDKAVFVTLADITSDLPNYEEKPIGVDMDVPTQQGYEDFCKRSQDIIKENPDSIEKFVFKIVQRMNQYPDQPYNQVPIFNNDTGEQIICPNNIMDKKDFISNKDRKTLELVRKHIANKEKVLIYVNWVNSSDCVDRLQKLFKDNSIKAVYLNASVSARNREKWIQDKIKSGIDVMICNPSLVETGLDLLDFTTIIFYQVGYNLFTMRQASRRSLRLNQSKDVNVYFLYFKNTIQESIISLMADKLQAAMAIEGKFSEEGLNAMSENDTLLTQLANNLTKNIDVKLEEGAFDFHTIKAQTSGNRFKEKAETMMKNWFFNVKPPKKSNIVINILDGLAEVGKWPDN